jgi:hypothetical protein
MNKKFNWQSFISIGLLFSFIIMFISGIVLYIAPEGSLSRWIGWDVLSLTKKQWEHQHTIFSYIFILFSIFHVFKINWGFILSYFLVSKIKISNAKEIIIASLITLLVFCGTLFNLSPFSSIINLGNNISRSHSSDVILTDIPDAEKLNLREFSSKVFNLTYKDFAEKLKILNYRNINEEIIVNDFCKLNDITPEQFLIVLNEELLLSKIFFFKNNSINGTFSSYSGNKKASI